MNWYLDGVGGDSMASVRNASKNIHIQMQLVTQTTHLNHVVIHMTILTLIGVCDRRQRYRRKMKCICKRKSATVLNEPEGDITEMPRSPEITTLQLHSSSSL
jgi:hypothetical protein